MSSELQPVRGTGTANRSEYTGYVHPAYARALSDLGSPRGLPGSGGWILQRPIHASPYSDAMGCYPLFACRDWAALSGDLEELQDELVSLVLVADPFGEYDGDMLRSAFPDVCRPYKEHFVVDLRRSPESFVSPHHRRNIRKAARSVEVEVCPNPQVYSREWIILYRNLIARHRIRGFAAFSTSCLAEMLRVPGLVMIRASHEGETVGIALWYIQGEIAYYHLAAYSDEGYSLRASFPLFDRAIQYFAKQVAWLNLGAGAGTTPTGSDGLTRFKGGWATGTRTAFLCGRILNARRYLELTRTDDGSANHFFPAYRRSDVA